MIIKKLEVENFRNHKKTIVDFNKNTTVFIGENGAGKTNLLEAIYSLAILKPFRNIKKNVFIGEDSDFAKVSAEIGDSNLEAYWEAKPRNRTVFKRNKVKLSTSNFLLQKNFHAVLFSPEDLMLPFAPPSNRRQFLNRILSTISAEYFSALLKFEKVLKSRNKLLQKFAAGEAKKEEFEYWDTEFVKLGEIIIKDRARLVNFLNEKIGDHFQKISKNKDVLEINFVPNSENLVQDLQKNFNKDVILKSTSTGPHRDDILLIFRNRPIVETGSRGEVRSAILALKLTERDFLKSETGSIPLMLFDDVFSELDENHRRSFFDLVADTQSIVTTTDIYKHEFDDMAAEVFEVKEGGIVKS